MDYFIKEGWYTHKTQRKIKITIYKFNRTIKFLTIFDRKIQNILPTYLTYLSRRVDKMLIKFKSINYIKYCIVNYIFIGMYLIEYRFFIKINR